MKYEAPEVLTGIKEIKTAYELAEYEAQRFISSLETLEKEIHTDTAGEEGIKRKEEIFKITPSGTLEERRKKVELFEGSPDCYSFGEIRALIKALTDEETQVTRQLSDTNGGRLIIKTGISSEKSLKDIIRYISRLLPAPMDIKASVIYRRFSDFSDKKFSDFGDLTFNELKRLTEEG